MDRRLWHSAPLTLLLLGCAGAPSEAEAPEATASREQAGQATSASVAPAPVDVAPAWQDDDPLAADDAVVEAEPAEPMPPPAAKPCIRVEGKCVGSSTGIQECDEYFATVISCKGMPKEAAKALVDAARTMADNVAKASDPQAREAFAQGCRTAREALTGCQ